MTPLVFRREPACRRVDLAEPPELDEERTPPRRPRSEDALWFERHRMVQWLAPRTLLGAASEVVLSGLFARFADKREIEGGLPCCWYDASGLETDGSLWVDFVSDTGDGFSPTYAVASTVARRELDTGDGPLARGRILVLGGDQVYPAASWSAYRDRFIGPWTSALPFSADAAQAPFLFALPGNHDWYDGLTSFMRLFAQGAWIGGWRTAQSRSYFAIKLPHDWWLWGIDTQFDSYIDAPQLDYFEAVGRELRRGEKLILATAKPSWIHLDAERRSDAKVPQSWRTLAFFQRRVIERFGGRLALTITGDLHHYCHYSESGEEPRRHMITAGGGGAYMSATHPTPKRLRVPDHELLTGGLAGRESAYARVAAYPEVGESRRLARGILWPPIVAHTPGFAVFTGALYGLLAFLIALSIRDGAPDFAELADGKPALDLAGDALGPVILASALAVALLAALIAFANVRSTARKAIYGFVHWLAHVGVLFAATVLVLDWIAGDGIGAPGPFVSELAVTGAGFLVGFVWGPVAFSLYLFAAHMIDGEAHANEVFAAQSRGAGSGYKHFVRIRVDRDGLTLFPVAIEGIPKHDPPLRSTGGDEDEWFDSSSLRPRPIRDPEAPIQVS